MRVAVLTLHFATLCAAVGVVVVSLGLGIAATGAALLLAAGPLVLGFAGLVRGRQYTQQWLSIALVFYVGLGLVETIASQGRSIAAAALLFTSATELALLFAVLRSVRPASRGSAGS